MSPLSSADTETPEAEADEPTTETDERREALLGEISERLGDGVVAHHIDPGQDIWVRIAPGSWADAAVALRRSLGFNYFTFLSALDWKPSPYGRSMDSSVDNTLDEVDPADPGPIEQGVTGGDTRFQVFARVYSTTRHLGVTLKVDVADDDLTIDTWTDTYPGANWHEREVTEMFGIAFAGHPNPIKLYLPADFEGHPLRKDFPLVSRMVKPWPGIVDVEPMPGEDEADDAEAGEDA